MCPETRAESELLIPWTGSVGRGSTKMNSDSKAVSTSGFRWPAVVGGLLGVLVLAAPGVAEATVLRPTTLADGSGANGDCTLRGAIIAANTDSPVDACPAGSGADRIELSAGTYRLSVPGAARTTLGPATSTSRAI